MDDKDKKIWELEQEKRLLDALKKAREEADGRYAIKLTEKAVFAIVALMGMTVFGTLMKVSIDYISALFAK